MKRLLTILILLLSVQTVDAQIVRPPELRLQFHRAERAWRTGASLHEAKRRLDQVIAELPEDTEALLLRGKVLLMLDDAEGAMEDAQATVGLEPENGEAWLLFAEAARTAGAVDTALSALKEAGDLIQGGADLHVRLSINARMLGDLDQAEAFARVARTQDPGSPAAHLQLARVFVAKNRTDAAATVLAGALENGVLSPADVISDRELQPLTALPALAAWF
ncbi:MAG: tetratricopeptide repeat protein [Rhodothermales bacterium]|nr:tetratricopeptide repeat protein [Rhodothermales bacterium]MBO6778264.1 tetratricopeptide repeat protein [Rhodothermales bacterium]